MSSYDNDEQEFDYRYDGNRRREPDAARSRTEKTSSSSRRMSYARSSRPAVSHNGIHRRRNKRFAW